MAGSAIKKSAASIADTGIILHSKSQKHHVCIRQRTGKGEGTKVIFVGGERFFGGEEKPNINLLMSDKIRWAV